MNLNRSEYPKLSISLAGKNEIFSNKEPKILEPKELEENYGKPGKMQHGSSMKLRITNYIKQSEIILSHRDIRP